MRRRVMLFVTTLGALLLGLLVYSRATREIQRAREPWVPPKVGDTGETALIIGTEGDRAAPGRDVKYDHYDRETHRLRARFRADYWQAVGERYRLTKPHLEWFLSSGETILVDADEGMVRARDIGGVPDVLEGHLAGNVRIVLDRNRDPTRGPLSQRPRDAVRIHLEDAHFDRDALLVRSDSRVSVFSEAADILGRGLRLSWSEKPQQLRELKIVHGEYMCIREQQDRFIKGWSLPGSRPRPKPTPRPGRSMLPYGPGWLGPWPVAAAMAQTTAPASTQTRPATRPAELPPVVKDTYVAVLTDNIRVTRGAKRLEGADVLELIFERSLRDRVEPEAEPEPEPSDRSPTTAPTSGPAGSKDPPVEPLVITWTGPLTVRPYRANEEHVPGRRSVWAGGPELRLIAEDGTEAQCTELKYSSIGDRGRLTGTDARPVRLKTADGQRVRARQIRFNGERNRIDIDGEGDMVIPGGDRRPVGLEGVKVGASDELAVGWTRDVQILVGERDRVVDGETEPEQFLREATFNGAVDVKDGPSRTIRAEKLTARFHPPGQGRDANRLAGMHADGGVRLVDNDTGEFIHAQTLDVEMGETADGRPYPRLATATGGVSARQEKTEIAADELTVEFLAATDEKTGKLAAKPRRLTAAGNIKLTDRSGKDPVTAAADKLTSDLAKQTAVLTGGPAKVTQSDSVIEGDRIVLDERREAATVDGKGKLHFMADTDFAGAKTDEPVPVDISWDERLEYRGKKRSAVVTGRVRMVSGGETLECRQLRVLFAEEDEKAAPDTRPADAPATYRPKKIAMVLADKDVKIGSLTTDEDGFWARRLSMWSATGQVVYEATRQRVACFGVGRLLVEDLRPPKPPKPDEPDVGPLSAGPDRPSQTIFVWSKSMELNQADLTANFVGNVVMSHRTGADMVKKEELKLHPAARLTQGRTMEIHCDRMFAQFAPPASPKADRARDPLNGDGVGPLELFRARARADDRRHRVDIRYDTYRILCRRIVFQRSKDLAILYGHLEDEPPANVEIINEDFKNRKFATIRNSQVLWRPRTNYFESKGVRVRGMR